MNRRRRCLATTPWKEAAKNEHDGACGSEDGNERPQRPAVDFMTTADRVPVPIGLFVAVRNEPCGRYRGERDYDTECGHPPASPQQDCCRGDEAAHSDGNLRR